MLEPGFSIDSYEVVRFVGRGGFADVYEVRDARLGARSPRLALKHLRTDYVPALRCVPASSPRLRKWFVDEVRVLGALDHVNVVTAMDFHHALHLGTYYVVFEYLEGPPLEALLAMREAPFGPDEASVLALGLARALGHVHAVGYTHNDVKPENVLLVGQGRTLGEVVDGVRLIDFGLARERQSGGAPAASPQAPAWWPMDQGFKRPTGTPAYMSPERFDKDALPEGTSDLYALGVILYELLSGQVWPATDYQTARSVARGVARGLTDLPEVTPAPLVDLVSACLAVDPGERPADPAVVCDVLRGVLHTRHGADWPGVSLPRLRRDLAELRRGA